ncbi:hypothetical protein BMS3Bbin14_02013 [bacterium BMS3Bbin14]|nr:hypothetical protein BMS3Bbin14_02013 [bacterium BMS3Bbin14]
MKKNNFAGNAETGQKGFTLIEVMVAMVILGIGILAIVALQARDMNYNSSSKRQTQAYTWAADRVERLLALPYTSPDLQPKGNPAVAGDGYTALMAPYVIEWDVINNTTTNSRKVSVFVRWKNKEIARVDFIRVQSSI